MDAFSVVSLGLGVVAPPGRAEGEALDRSLVLYMIEAGVAVTWFIPEAMSLRGTPSHCDIPAEPTKHGRRIHEI